MLEMVQKYSSSLWRGVVREINEMKCSHGWNRTSEWNETGQVQMSTLWETGLCCYSMGMTSGADPQGSLEQKSDLVYNLWDSDDKPSTGKKK